MFEISARNRLCTTIPGFYPLKNSADDTIYLVDTPDVCNSSNILDSSNHIYNHWLMKNSRSFRIVLCLSFADI